VSVLLNAYCTLIAPPTLGFPHTLIGARGQSDPGLAPHLEGFVSYVLGTGGNQMTYTLYHVMRHIQRVQVQFSFEVGEGQSAQVSAWAQQANAVLYWPDGTVRSAQGRVLVYPDGAEPDAGADVPYPPDALDRKARTEEQLAGLGIHVPSTLPPVVAEGEVRWRSAAEVARRALALAAVAVVAETRGEGDPMPIANLETSLPGYAAFLSPDEQAFLAERSSSPAQIAKFSWRYEALALLQWALGWQAELPYPTEICDVASVMRAALGHTRRIGAAACWTPSICTTACTGWPATPSSSSSPPRTRSKRA
jgi:Domain of unknown function (DUF4272)